MNSKYSVKGFCPITIMASRICCCVVLHLTNAVIVSYILIATKCNFTCMSYFTYEGIYV